MLSKGFEVELYTGKPTGEIVGLSDRIVRDLPGFVREPDSRNVEFTTPPVFLYDQALCDLLRPRFRLRAYLQSLGDLTLVPGSTLSLGDSQRFYRSDPQNPYHTYIEQTYGTRVVTASVHINIGLRDPEELIRACRLVRLEASLFLALSAASPFLDGKVTGYHSTRWAIFPKTPPQVPLFTSHAHFIEWTEQQLQRGTMQNVRHLWSAVRPNGDRRPYDLNRLELRICDLVTDAISLLAMTALLEARLLQLLDTPDLDPLRWGDGDMLAQLADNNEQLVAKSSLEAVLTHWRDRRQLTAAAWVAELYEEVWPIAKAQGFSCFLAPIKKILRQGNTAQQWLAQYAAGQSIPEIMATAVQEMAATEQEFADQLCQPVAAVRG
ncbi:MULTISPECIES: glutamate--cysteine ligase [unclassified Thermosynechococcus]|uniref:glutamate--cysteine ligase n=1 Tax=unclassified Thermosynechococcus TaxID=2622553 RepID=UPI002873BB30|nr:MULTISPECIES: glutamate--cysteine ligase [unclassified Thermosynechococcus]WNC32614.1 glutamate--cysteine ligase [Thermosynechococcus sp. PKX95]WNC35143.1 glutamate--cysteine ligase [Thermosynechococcus sp. PKX91]WNC37661.1 glutamate--cysteine ligase [Thermosynechococcus sp. WL11]WNC40182.1 glutamate--cysteine ligase [Thermosynechococcus sp. WL17]WNC42702.1 glutamate--cysteine ligase [Thermosynechococcus sp. WL15]